MSSFLHLLFGIIIISDVTRDLSQGGNFTKRGHWPALKQQLRNAGESGRGWLH